MIIKANKCILYLIIKINKVDIIIWKTNYSK